MQLHLQRRQEAGVFLRSRRERLRPEHVGLDATSRRRVPGLRRDELARLAGVSVEYYIRLEQGRAGSPSESVLAALARALRLDDAELSHLRDLWQPAGRQRRATAQPERVRPALRRMLDVIATPALIFGRFTDVLAWNHGAATLLTDFDRMPLAERNLARLLFLDEGYAALMVDWERVARETVGILRLAGGRHPDDPRLASLVGELTLNSEHFARWWHAREVRQKTSGTKRLHHPLVGRVDLAYETFQAPNDPEQTLVAFFPIEPGNPAETALRLLDTPLS